MPATGAANIDSNGVLVSTSGLKSLTLSDDQATVSIGAGSKWVDVLNFLEPYGLATVGGRVGLVGVSGYTLGGGISFYGNQYGFASANVVAYQVRSKLNRQISRSKLILVHRLSSRLARLSLHPPTPTQTSSGPSKAAATPSPSSLNSPCASTPLHPSTSALPPTAPRLAPPGSMPSTSSPSLATPKPPASLSSPPPHPQTRQSMP